MSSQDQTGSESDSEQSDGSLYSKNNSVWTCDNSESDDEDDDNEDDFSNFNSKSRNKDTGEESSNSDYTNDENGDDSESENEFPGEIFNSNFNVDGDGVASESENELSDENFNSDYNNDGNGDASESEHDLPGSALDNKLDNVSIMKIDTNQTNLVENGVSIPDVNNLKLSEKIIKKIVGRTRKNNEHPAGPRAKKPRLDSTETDIHASAMHKRNVDELELTPQIKRLLKEKGMRFNLKLYLVEANQESSFTKSFAELVTDNSRKRLFSKNVVKSFILFFYRNVENTPGKSTASSFSPEIFAVTTGSARCIVSRYTDKDFTKLVEKRTLRFPFQKVTLKPDGGSISNETKSARPGHDIICSVWDFLENFVGNRIRRIRENSSLYENSLEAFRTKAGNPKNTKFHISKNSMKIMCKLNILQIGSILDHFSKICKRRKTYLVTKNEEEDDQRFEMQELFTSVTDENLLQKLDKHLYQELEMCMKGGKSHIVLSHQSERTWRSAEEFRLYARTPTKQMEEKERKCKRKNIGTWHDYPRLDAIMEQLGHHFSNKFEEEWLNDAVIKFRSKEAPLKKCIFSRFSNAGIGTYIYNYGEWIEVKAQYLYLIERHFVEKMSAHLLEASKLKLLLPWKHLGGKREKEINIKNVDGEKMKPKWKKHFETICKRGPFDRVFVKIENLQKEHTDITLNYNTLTKKNASSKAAHLYLLLERNLNEENYNAAHTLLNMILPDNSKTHVLTCDKKMPHGIELCDILIYNDRTTYLVHVKAEFNGNSIRAVCSQIRNAADCIYREQTLSEGPGIIDRYWQELTKDTKKSKTHENEVKRCLEEMSQAKFKELFHPGREIVFVLACSDTRMYIDFSRDIPFSNDREVDVRDEIRNKFPGKYAARIIKKLKAEEYLTDQGTPRDKFILKGKARLDRNSFLDILEAWDVFRDIEDAKTVHEILLSVLPMSESTVAKMEIIRLIKNFQSYHVDKEKFHLKICNICKDFPDF